MKNILGISVLILISAMCMLPADSPYQGRLQITTDHFQIIFEPRDIEYAEEIARFADEVLYEISDLLGYLPSERIPVALAGRTAWANGFYSPFPHSITLYVTSPANRFMGSRTSDWLYSLFVHELTHYVHLTSPEGPAKFLAPLFGPDVKAMNAVFMPGWWLEGITTYAETEYAEGGRGEDPRSELTWKAPILEDAMWSIRQGAYQSSYPPSGRIYITGYIFTDYLVQRFGSDIFSRINSRFLRFPFFGISHSVKKETGYSANELYQDMIDSYEKLFKSTAQVRGAPFSPQIIGNYHLPRPTSEGWIGWYDVLGSVPSLARYTSPEETPDPLAKVRISDSVSYDISADGTLALVSAYWSDRTHGASFPNAPVSYSDLYLVDLTSGNSDQITSRARLYHPALSPDGRNAAAVERSGTRYRLVRADLETGLLETLYEHPSGSIYEPSFSHDGTRIAAVEVVDGRASIILVESNGTSRLLWPHSAEGIYSPRFTPDGSILFSSDRTGSPALYRITPDSGITELLLQDPMGVLGGDILDNTLVYSTYRSSGYSLRSISAEKIIPILAETPEEIYSAPQEDMELVRYETKKYRDFPRLGMWLPLPILEADSSLAPGAWVLMQGVLGTHLLQVSAGWRISEEIPVIQAQYRYSPGWGSLLIRGDLNRLIKTTYGSYREHAVSGTLVLPLWGSSSMDSTRLLTSIAFAEYRTSSDSKTLILLGQGGYQWMALHPRGAFYGGSSTGIFGGIEAGISPDSGTVNLYPLISSYAQARLPWKNHAVRTEIDAVAMLGGTFHKDLQILLPKGNTEWVPDDSTDVRAKIRTTLQYRMPLAVLDQPIPYGGLLGTGMTLFAQSAIYFPPGGIAWEEDIYAGIEIAADITVGALAQLRPYAGITFSLLRGGYKFFAGLQLSSYMQSNHAEILRL